VRTFSVTCRMVSAHVFLVHIRSDTNGRKFPSLTMLQTNTSAVKRSHAINSNETWWTIQDKW